MADDDLRRELNSLSRDMVKGLGGMHVVTEIHEKEIRDLKAGLTETNRKLEELKTDTLKSIASIDKTTAVDLAKMQKDVEDVTGTHRVDTVDTVTLKKDEIAIEHRKIDFEEKKVSWQTWAAIAAVAVPGIVSIILQLLKD